MQAIRAFRAEHPDAAVRPDALTSLHILDGLRAGRLAVGIVRGPVAEPDRVASVPLARVPVDHVVGPARPSPGRRRTSSTPATSMANQCSWSIAATPRLRTTRSRPTARRWAPGRAGSPTPPPRSNGCSTWWPWATGIGWLNAWQAEREAGRADVVVRPLQPGRPVRRVPRGLAGRRHRRRTTAAFVRVVLETCGA